MGLNVAEKILTDINYEKSTIAEVKRLILKHDNWAFGDSFVDEPVLLAFNNYDFMWMASEKGFDVCRAAMKMEPKEFYHKIEKFQQENINRGSRWFNKGTEDLYVKMMVERKKENCI